MIFAINHFYDFDLMSVRFRLTDVCSTKTAIIFFIFVKGYISFYLYRYYRVTFFTDVDSVD